MKFKILLCLALVLSGGLLGCTTVQLPRQGAVSYSPLSSASLQKIKVERISLAGEQLAERASLPKDKTEFDSRWLVERKPDTMHAGPWDTRLYIFDSADTNRCVRVELLDHASYEVRHAWLNEKMLFVEVPWGRIAWTDFVLDTETLHFAYIEDGVYNKMLEQQEKAESFNGYGLNEITSHIFGIEGKIIHIRETPGELKSITVEVIKPLPTALGWIPYDKPGESMVIHFDESLSKLDKLHLATGDIVKVAFGNGIQSRNPDDWGSNFSWLYVEKNGHFYNTKGEVVDSDPDENL
jgi:hypothetical protein